MSAAAMSPITAKQTLSQAARPARRKTAAFSDSRVGQGQRFDPRRIDIVPATDE